LTIQKIRRYPGLEALTDNEAKEAIEGISKLAEILLGIVKQHEIISHENKSSNT
jgi:hypothetical protein